MAGENLGNVEATVPKTITRIKTEYHGFPVKYLIAVFATAMFLLFMITGALFTKTVTGKIIFLILAVLGILFFAVVIRSPKQMDISWNIYKYLVRALNGKTIVAKYAIPASFLESVVPVRKFHENGLIEFVGNQYGVLMSIEPSRIADDELDSHIAKNRELADSLHGELFMKFFVISISSNNNELERNVVNIINNEDRSSEQKDHLYSIYHHLKDSKKTVIQWKYYIFISLGSKKNLDMATIAMTQYIPGIEAKLHKSGVHVVIVSDHNELAIAYRQCLNVRMRA